MKSSRLREVMVLAQGHPVRADIFATIHSMCPWLIFPPDEELPRTSHLYLCLPRAWHRVDAETIADAWAV